MPWIKKHMRTVLETKGPIPDAYIAVENGQVAGGYTLAVKEVLSREDTGLWIATLYMAPGFRGRHLSPVLMDHARRRGGELGYEKIYLASEHTNYYEKYGFHTIGPTPAPGANPPRCLRTPPCRLSKARLRKPYRRTEKPTGRPVGFLRSMRWLTSITVSDILLLQ